MLLLSAISSDCCSNLAPLPFTRHRPQTCMLFLRLTRPSLHATLLCAQPGTEQQLGFNPAPPQIGPPRLPAPRDSWREKRRERKGEEERGEKRTPKHDCHGRGNVLPAARGNTSADGTACALSPGRCGRQHTAAVGYGESCWLRCRNGWYVIFLLQQPHAAAEWLQSRI